MTYANVAARARDLIKIYGKEDAEVRALNGVSLDIAAGEFTAVMGPSGSGKSTFMHCMAALDVPSSGSVFIGDVNVADLGDKDLTELRRDEIGFIFQAFNLLPTLTARENILLPMSIAGRRPDDAWFDRVIKAVGLESRLDHRPTELSGGQQQRVACARALVSRPSIIFADEPTGNLDSTSGAEVLRFLRHSVDEFEQTIVMVTHDAVAASYTDRVIFLADGKLVDEIRNPSAEEVLSHMAELQQKIAEATPLEPLASLEPLAPIDDLAPSHYIIGMDSDPVPAPATRARSIEVEPSVEAPVAESLAPEPVAPESLAPEPSPAEPVPFEPMVISADPEPTDVEHTRILEPTSAEAQLGDNPTLEELIAARRADDARRAEQAAAAEPIVEPSPVSIVEPAPIAKAPIEPVVAAQPAAPKPPVEAPSAQEALEKKYAAYDLVEQFFGTSDSSD